MNRRTRAFALAVILLGAITTGARADQIITVDLYVTAATNLTLSSTFLDMTLVPVSGSGAFPFFEPVEPVNTPTTQQTGFMNDNNYVFYPQSFSYQFSLPFWDTLQTGPPPYSYPNGEIFGGDESNSAQGYVTLAAGSTYLLAQVLYDNPSSNGETFQVVPTSGGLTEFDDQYGNPLTITSYTSNNSTTATFSISANAVPEPSSSTLLAISSALCGLLWYRGFRKGRTS